MKFECWPKVFLKDIEDQEQQYLSFHHLTLLIVQFSFQFLATHCIYGESNINFAMYPNYMYIQHKT